MPDLHHSVDQLPQLQLLSAAPLSGPHHTADQLLPVQLLPATQFPDAGNHSASAALSSGCPVSASKNDVQTSAVKKTVKPVSDDYSALRIFLESLLPVSAPLSPPIVEDRATLVQKLSADVDTLFELFLELFLLNPGKTEFVGTLIANVSTMIDSTEGHQTSPVFTCMDLQSALQEVSAAIQQLQDMSSDTSPPIDAPAQPDSVAESSSVNDVLQLPCDGDTVAPVVPTVVAKAPVVVDNKCLPAVAASSSFTSLPYDDGNHNAPVMADNKCPSTVVASTPSDYQCSFDDICAIQRDQVYVCLVADPRWTQWISPDIPTGQQAYHNPCSTIVPWTPQCAISSAFSNFQFIVIETLDHNFYKDTCDNSAFKFILWDSFTHLNVDLNFYKLELCHIGLLSSHISDHEYIIALFSICLVFLFRLFLPPDLCS